VAHKIRKFARKQGALGWERDWQPRVGAEGKRTRAALEALVFAFDTGEKIRTSQFRVLDSGGCNYRLSRE